MKGHIRWNFKQLQMFPKDRVRLLDLCWTSSEKMKKIPILFYYWLSNQVSTKLAEIILWYRKCLKEALADLEGALGAHATPTPYIFKDKGTRGYIYMYIMTIECVDISVNS